MCENNLHKNNWFFYNSGDNEAPIAHKIVRSEPSETPGGSECFDHTARCGAAALEWATRGSPPIFCKSLQEALAQGAVPCPECNL